MFFGAASYEDSLWVFWWVWNAFWQFSYLILTLLIAFLWRPNHNNKRYAWSAQLVQEPQEKEDDLTGDVQLKGIPEDKNESSDEGGSTENDSVGTDQLEQLVL